MARCFVTGTLKKQASLMNRGEFYDRVCDICARFQCSMTSGWRTHKRNKERGGVWNSYHLNGMAIDIVPDDNTVEIRDSIVAYAKQLGLQGLDEADHVHIANRS